MSGDDVEVKFTATTSDFTSRVAELNSSFRQFDAAAAGTKSVATEAAGGMGIMQHATAGVTRELIVLGHEAVTGRFTRIPGSLMVLAERFGGLNLTALAVGAGLAVAGYAIYEMASKAEAAVAEVKSLDTALGAMGKVGTSGTALEQEIDKLSMLPGVSREAATEVIDAYTRMNGISGDQISKLADVTAKFATVQKVTVQEAAKMLGKAFGDISKGAEELQHDMAGGLNPSLVDLAIRQDEAGNRAQAFATLMGALSVQLTNVNAGPMSSLKKVLYDIYLGYESATAAAGAFAKMVGGMPKAPEQFGPEQSQEQIAAAQKQAEADAASRASLETALGLSRQMTGEAGKRLQLTNELKQLEAGAAAPQATQGNKDDILAKEREVQQQLDDLHSQETTKVAAGLSEQRRLYAENSTDFVEKERLKVEAGKETSDEMYQKLYEEKTAEAVLSDQSFQKELALYNQQSKAWTTLHDQMLSAEQKFQNELDKLRLEQQKQDDADDKKYVDGWMKSLSSVNSAFASSFTSMLAGSKNFTQVFQSLARSMFESFIKDTLQAGEKWLIKEATQTTATAAGTAARTTTTTAAAVEGAAVDTAASSASIFKSASAAAAGAYAAISPIPFVGPFLAPIAAATVFAAALAFDSFDVGTDMVQKSGLANIHAGEMIVPKEKADDIRGKGTGAFTGAGLGGGEAETHFHFHSHAIDSKSVDHFFQKNAQKMADTMRGHMRGGAARATMSRM